MINKLLSQTAMHIFSHASRLRSFLTAAAIVICMFSGLRVTAQGGKPQIDDTFFNGQNLTGWSASDMSYWSVEDGVIIGQFEEQVLENEFLWSDVGVEDFYLCIDVLLEPEDRNAGIQFRSKKTDESGQAIGYQADVGKGVWGRLYHEHGRGKLDWTDRGGGGGKAVKPGQWNRYEILASGHRIWTALNGTLSVAVNDPAGELKGHIALQIHGGHRKLLTRLEH